MQYINTHTYIKYIQFAVVQSLSHVWLFATLWTAACQDSLSFTISLSLLKLMSVESVMPSNHLIFCHPLLLSMCMHPHIQRYIGVYIYTMATHSSTLAWKIPWTEEPGSLWSMGSRRVRHDGVTSLSLFTFMHWRRKWQPTPVFLPGESQG